MKDGLYICERDGGGQGWRMDFVSDRCDEGNTG